jgi:hypothetical protein
MVAKLLLHVLEGLARFDQETGIGVPQGVRLAVEEPGPAQDRPKAARARWSKKPAK